MKAINMEYTVFENIERGTRFYTPKIAKQYKEYERRQT
jgi:hypothetical protein